MAAAASNKPGWIHYCFIFSILCTLVLGVLTWMQASQIKESIATWEADKKKAQDAVSAQARILEERENIKKALGILYENTGTPGDNAGNAVLPEMARLIAQAGDLAQPTFKDTLVKVMEANAALTANLNEMTAESAQLKQKVADLESEYNQRVIVETRSKNDAEATLAQKIQQSSEELDQKNKEIETKAAALKQAQDDYAALEDEYKKSVEEREKRIKNLNESVKRLRDELLQIRDYSFENPDGQIVVVDSIGRSLTINLGKADNLTKRVLFSVYTKANSGVARRGKEDIKGQIEVIEVMGPHLAKARIIGESQSNPIAPGDPIYTPLWSPGRTESFAFVGRFDLDGDGKDDREVLHELIAAHGARIDTEITMKGERIGKAIDQNTKFLVMGETPDPTSSADAETIRAYQSIQDFRKKLKEEADENGVQTVTMNDFLSWVGYKPQHKLHRPGEPIRNTLVNGALSPTTREPLGQRISTGAITGAGSSDRFKPSYDRGLAPKR